MCMYGKSSVQLRSHLFVCLLVCLFVWLFFFGGGSPIPVSKENASQTDMSRYFDISDNFYY